MSTAPTGAQRIVAPDLARGLMLLFIAIANVSLLLWLPSQGGMSAHPEGGTVLDRITAGLVMMGVDGRIQPLFAFLFGYGMVQFAASRRAHGFDERQVRRQLQRRHLWLIVFGIVHATLLWFGDILAPYGLVGLIIVWLLFSRSDRAIAITAWILGSLVVLNAIGMALLMWSFTTFAPPEAEMTGGPGMGATMISGESSYLLSAGMRLGFLLMATVITPLVLTVPLAMLLGILAARHGLLDDPHRQHRLLVRLALIGIPLAWILGAPGAIGHIIESESLVLIFSLPSMMLGIIGGLGYAALFALIAARLKDPERGIARAIQGVGRRSLSFYLLQSVLMAPLLSAWGLGLGDRVHSAGAFAIAIGVWVISVILGGLCEANGWRGPAEILLRRLTAYGDVPHTTVSHTAGGSAEDPSSSPVPAAGIPAQTGAAEDPAPTAAPVGTAMPHRPAGPPASPTAPPMHQNGRDVSPDEQDDPGGHRRE